MLWNLAEAKTLLSHRHPHDPRILGKLLTAHASRIKRLLAGLSGQQNTRARELHSNALAQRAQQRFLKLREYIFTRTYNKQNTVITVIFRGQTI